MAIRFETHEVIDRPIDKVFQFYAVQHVRNHPRWDPDIDLWLDANEPIGVGTIIRRRNRRSGTAVEGTMEVKEFEVDRVIAVLIHDGPAVMRGRTTFEAVGAGQTRITTVFEIPGMDENADRSFLNSRLERSARLRKQLMEAEL